MSETPEHVTEPATGPVVTAHPATTYDERPAYVEPTTRKSNRLYQAAAWVAIVAGSVFIVAVIFFTGFALGAHSGGGHHGGGRHQEMDNDRDGGPPMMPIRPGFIFPGGPGGFGPGGGPGMFPGGPGPGNFGPGQGQQPPSPSTQQRPS